MAQTMLALDNHRNWPLPKRSWFMRMMWHDLCFMHWPVDAEQLRANLPVGLELDLYEGQAWIGIVPFRMSGVAPRWVPDLPWMSAFPELNVRTYVIRDGKPGVWFYSLDATNPVAVRGARYMFNLSYMDAQIRCKEECEWWHYDSRRTHRGEPAAVLNCEYRGIGDLYTTQPGSLDHWLTSRYCLYAANIKGQLYRGEIDHTPWQLQDCQAIIHENTMTDGIGVALPDRAPLLHFAKTTSVVAWSLQSV